MPRFHRLDWPRRLRLLSLPLVATALVLAISADAVASQESAPILEGQKYFMATHSFNVFIGPNRRAGGGGPLQALADEAGIDGHENIGVQMIGGSTPMQHWNQGGGDDSRNLAKVALRAGGVDVFTMSPNARMPEDGIDLFGDLMIETNPMGRILVQNSWSAWDGNGMTPSVGGSGSTDFSNGDRDQADLETIQGWMDRLESEDGYLRRMRTQLAGINERAGRDLAFVVPSAAAVYRLRQEVLRGDVPGVAHQSELFVDAIGHPARPVANLVTYVWFTAMYHRSPVGLTALIDADDPTSAEREELLQRIAWNAVIAEPMSGVVGAPLMLEGVH